MKLDDASRIAELVGPEMRLLPKESARVAILNAKPLSALAAAWEPHVSSALGFETEPELFSRRPVRFETGREFLFSAPIRFEITPELFETSPMRFQTGTEIFFPSPKGLETGLELLFSSSILFETESIRFETGSAGFGIRKLTNFDKELGAPSGSRQMACAPRCPL